LFRSVTILKEATTDILDRYDFVLIDCPPNLGIITLNGIIISDYYLIPCIPDILSTYGIPQILDRIKMFKQESKIDIDPLGIILSMYRAQSRLHDSTIQDLKVKASSGVYPRIFETIIPLSVRTAESVDISSVVNTLKQKYGYGRSYDNYKNLTEEFLRYV
ncbi:hypothetical protein EPN87_04400, partial [archaeon]